MKQRIKTLSQWSLKWWRRALLSVGVLALLMVIWVWLVAHVPGFAAAGNPKTQQYQPAKTIWDLLQLFIVPLVLAGAAIWFNARRGKTEREIAQDQQRETMLQGYLDRMSDLLLKEHLRESKEGDEIRQVARAHTLTVLRRLDTERKTALFRFLVEAQLVGSGHHIISLQGVDLSGAELFAPDLSGTNFAGAKLSGTMLGWSRLVKADLTNADLTQTTLRAANLHNAWLDRARLNGADLNGANLQEASLFEAKLGGANLGGADLTNADLRYADLRDAVLTAWQLRVVKSLEGATMPDGTKHI